MTTLMSPLTVTPIAAPLLVAAPLLLLPSQAQASRRSRAHKKAAVALAAFHTGVAHYKMKRFVDAAAQFRAAYELDPKPVYLFNAARATQRDGEQIVSTQCVATESTQSPKIWLPQTKVGELTASASPPIARL